MLDLIIAYCGITLGVFLRTMSPAMRKMKEVKAFKWDHSYSVSGITALLACLFFAYLLLPMFPFHLKDPLLVFPSAFTFGFGSNSIINELKKVILG